MTETQWLECTDPLKMLRWVWIGRKRKSRLFAVACCRYSWDLFVDERSRKAIEVAERYADGAASDEELQAAASAAHAAQGEVFQAIGKVGASIEWAAAYSADPNPLLAAKRVSWMITQPRVKQVIETTDDGIPKKIHLFPCTITKRGQLLSHVLGKWKITMVNQRQETNAQAPVQSALIRCIFGNPFRTVNLDPAYLEWNNGTVVQVAREIYQERAFDRLPTLAVLLQEAGCSNEDILKHCRDPGWHARACWVVDMLLGKE